MNNETFESLLSELVGDNVGSNCSCSSCEDNRQEIRDAVESLISHQTFEFQKRVEQLEAENSDLKMQLSK